jgi:hypothetical protein
MNHLLIKGIRTDARVYRTRGRRRTTSAKRRGYEEASQAEAGDLRR